MINKTTLDWRNIEGNFSESEKAFERLQRVTNLVGKPDLQNQFAGGKVIDAAAGKNCEQMIGELTIPLGVAGPIKFIHKKISTSVLIPLATTEGALIASVQRGSKAISQAKKVVVITKNNGTTRAPVFIVNGLVEGQKAISWIGEHKEDLDAVACTTSKHLRLLSVHPQQIGKNVYVRLAFDTGEAMGMNMVTIATEAIVQHIEQKTGSKCIAVSGNGCVDKKPSWTNILHGRGIESQVEVRLPRQVVKDVLKTTPEKIIDVVYRKQWLGSMQSGTMGFNAHYANIVAAIFLASGQDIAHVVEGSLGITTAELVQDDLYFSVWLPNVMVGTVGGGTHLPVQQASLKLMGLGFGKPGEKERLAAIIGVAVLCGELSLSAALATNDLGKAHTKLGRKP